MNASTGFVTHALSDGVVNTGTAGVPRFTKAHNFRSAGVYVPRGATTSDPNARETRAKTGAKRRIINPPVAIYLDCTSCGSRSARRCRGKMIRMLRWIWKILLLAGFLVPAPAQDDLPAGKGKEILENTCTECHGLDKVLSQLRTKRQWREIAVRMRSKGATMSDDELKTLVEYL